MADLLALLQAAEVSAQAPQRPGRYAVRHVRRFAVMELASACRMSMTREATLAEFGDEWLKKREARAVAMTPYERGMWEHVWRPRLGDRERKKRPAPEKHAVPKGVIGWVKAWHEHHGSATSLKATNLISHSSPS